LFIVPSLYMLIAKEHHEKSLMDVGWEGAPEEDQCADRHPDAEDESRDGVAPRSSDGAA